MLTDNRGTDPNNRVGDPFVKLGTMRADARRNYEQLLATARDLLTSGANDVSLRHIAREADVGLGTLQRHFPTREALLEALLRDSFDDLTVRARDLEAATSAGPALLSWFGELVAVAQGLSGAVASMVAAIEDEASALHASCIAMQAAGTRLLSRAQADGSARRDIDGADLFALVGALAWVHAQPALAPRADRLFMLMANAILVVPNRSKKEGGARSE